MSKPHEATPVPEKVSTSSKQRKEREPFVELAQDAECKWHWCLWTANGKSVAMNVDGFERQNDAWRSFLAAQELMGRPGGVSKQVTQNHRRGTARRRKLMAKEAARSVVEPPKPETVPPMANPIMEPATEAADAVDVP